MKTIKYQSNIDTLRGISILLVVIYHLKLDILNYKFLPGGYLGVDIFFVISGYLITSILSLNVNNGKFDFKNFYLRRFLRIVPVYIFVIFITLTLSYYILLPQQLVELSESSVSSIIFLSNIFFWKYLNNYYNPEAIFNPLLHTWSLGIEIQFYLFFPLFFFIIRKFTTKIYIPLLIVGLLSLLISEIASHLEPQVNFFGIQSRLWEFILGSLLFFLKDKINLNLNYLIKNLLYLIILSFSILFNEYTRHPSLITFLFLFFVAILILDTSKENQSYLGRVFIFFGLISYSLYLWHYPVFSLSKRIFFNEGNNIKVLLLIFSIILSYCSYYFLEKKLRIDLKKTFYFVILFLTASLALSFLYIKNSGFKERIQMSEFYKNSERSSISYNYNLDNKFNSFSEKNILIIGNSHSVHTYGGFVANKELYKKLNFSNFHIQIYCLKESIFKQERDLCKGFLDQKEKYLFLKGKENFKNSNIIILSTRWTDEGIEALPSVIDFLKKYNKKIIIFSSIVDISKNDTYNKLNNRKISLLQKNFSSKLFPFKKYLFLNNKYPEISELDFFERMYFKNSSSETYLKNNKLKKIATEYNVPFLDINKFICDDKIKKCKVITDKKKHIMDNTTGHLTEDGDQYLIKLIYKDLIKIIGTVS